jgi:glucose/arabinose dehydrogenase/mono/diheme cytochrome c family protein
LKYFLFFPLLSAGIFSLLYNFKLPDKTSDDGPSHPKSPTEQLESFQIEPGLKIQLVASEPFVQDPVVITFDEDGRLWVVEMRGFMPDIEGEGENEPVGRISVLEDTDGDGVMDISTIYMDSLVMPRAIAIVPGGALVVENMALWFTEDLDGDLKADSKTLIDPDYAGNTLPEHSGNGLWRGIDNWYYNAKSKFRYRLVAGQWERDSTESRGQWGISHDDYGRLIYNYNWSQLHADLVPPNYLFRNRNHTPTTGIDHGLTVDRRIFPIRSNPAVNRGYIPGTLDAKGRLLEFTAACAPLYYRGQALPEEYYGNVFVCEPSGNLIKRNIIKSDGIYLNAEDPNSGREFLASTDERFRPVHLASGPDGALYVADMYRGLVQHGAYISPYLKEQTLRRNLVLPINKGRIWRIVPENWTPVKPVKLSLFSSEELVRFLAHPDGWYRDIAQRLLVERNDVSVKASLRNMALKGKNDYGRIQALWTLEGLKLLDPELLFEIMYDPNPYVKANAIRLFEPMVKKDKDIRLKLEKVLLEEWKHAPIEQLLQISLSADVLNTKVSHSLLRGIAIRAGSLALIRDAVISSLQDQEHVFLMSLLKSKTWKNHDPDREIFIEMLTAAIVRKGNSSELKELLDFLDVGRDVFGWQQHAILTGMSIQGTSGAHSPIQITAAPGILKRKNLDIEPERLNGMSALFEWPGHKANKLKSTKDNILDEEEQRFFALGRQHYLSTCSGCHGTNGAGVSRLGPPLKKSDWVTGDEKQLVLLVLQGMEGPVEVDGKIYDAPEILPVMPAHSTLDDATISSILTYIRNEWGNNAGAVSRSLVGKTRISSQGRVYPWKAEELRQFILEEKAREQ